MEPPIFHTKEERQKLALQRRLKEVASRAEFRGNNTERRTADHRNRRDREHEDDPESRKRTRLEKSAEIERETDLAALREHYLGSTKNPKTRVVKPSEKFRFSFDWDSTDDTSRRTNSPYPHQVPILFGRGFLAGTDRREQKKLAAARNEKPIRENIGLKAANSYDMRADRHWTDKLLDEMTERDWRIFKEDFSISYKGSKVTHPLRSWAESNLGPDLLKAIDRAGYKTPSPIQMAAIPLGLHHRDVIGVAETGSGKTAAFVLPMLNYISTLPPINASEGPYALILAPTRELAQQIEDETEKLAHYIGVNVVSIVGGQSIENQGSKISKGCHVIVATPGRLLDCLERRYIVLNQCDYIVLDEADRMVDMGFESQLVSILDSIPSTFPLPENENENEATDIDQKKTHRTTYMFSATMPPGVERLARKYLRNPVVVSVGTAGKTADLIAQHVIMTRENEKMGRLKKLLDDKKKAIVFVNTKNVADHVGRCLDREGYRVTTVHSRKTQEQRETSLDGFRSKRFDVLVGTDVVGRGIDVPDVAHVINYDMAKTIEGYTHRIGRTGRAGKTGVATTFLTLGDVEVFYDLKQMLIQSNCFVPPELARHEASKFKPGSLRGL